MREQLIWKGAPSQLSNMGFFSFYVISVIVLNVLPLDIPFAITLLPAVIGYWQFLSTQHTEYELTNERLISHSGIYSKIIDELELYRIRDFRLQQPAYLRPFGLANVVLLTADITSPTLVISAIPNARKLLDDIRRLVEARRDMKGVRSVDVGQFH
ncbi:MAG: PH domain-containing protein [Pseudomonadota bacterium]